MSDDASPIMSFPAKVVAGAVAGATSKTVFAPIERVRLLSQCGHSAQFNVIVHKEGALGLWRGNGLAVARATLQKGILFSTQDSLRVACGSDAVAGGVAGVLAGGITYPLDLLRTRIAGQMASSGLFYTVAESVAKHGPLALYSGASATLMGGSVFESLRFGIFGWLQSRGERDSIYGAASDGAAASLVAGNIIYPNDTIRRRLQSVHGQGESYVQALTMLFREGGGGVGGVQRLYRGFLLYNLKAVPSAFLQFATFHALKQALSNPP